MNFVNGSRQGGAPKPRHLRGHEDCPSSTSPVGLRPPYAGDGHHNPYILQQYQSPKTNSHVVQLPESFQEDKIRILRQVDSGRSVAEVCQEHNLSQVSFYRWKKQFGQMEVNEAKRMKELERENTELKKMLAESLLKNRVLELVCEKKL